MKITETQHNHICVECYAEDVDYDMQKNPGLYLVDVGSGTPLQKTFTLCEKHLHYLRDCCTAS